MTSVDHYGKYDALPAWAALARLAREERCDVHFRTLLHDDAVVITPRSHRYERPIATLE
jgi:hypothetical protein